MPPPAIIHLPAGTTRTTVTAVALFVAPLVQGAETIPVAVRVPADTPIDDAVFLAGSLAGVGSWRADGVRLTRATDGTCTGTLTLEAGQALEYKFTRGSWDAVEKTSDGGERPNRVRPAGTGAAPIQDTIECWAAGGSDVTHEAKPGTVVGTLQIVPVPVGNNHAARMLRVWLPAGYGDPTAQATRYPVLYLQDGQNCFDRVTSAFGSEWQVDETLTRLVAGRDVPPLIVVGIDNAGADRTREYTFVPGPRDGGGDGAAYAEWLLHTVMPMVEQAYRVAAGPVNTFIGGSSLGGLVSLEIARRHPGVFGSVLAMSPSLWWDDEELLKELEQDSTGLFHTRVWVDMGTREVVPGPSDPRNRQMEEEARRLDAVLGSRGVEDHLSIDEGGQHNEAAWAKRFPAAIVYLTGKK